jgi:hypothetical protein
VGPTAGLNRCGNCRPHWDSTFSIQLVVSRHTNTHVHVQSDATSVEDVECLGCSSTSKTDENVD